jgi:protein-tyrosine kinase
VSKVDDAIRKLRDSAKPVDSAKPAPRSERPFEPGTTEVVALDDARLEGLGYSIPLEDRRLLSDQYRMIKRPLIAQAFGRAAEVENGNFLQVSSAIPGEGKTFTCLHLALSIAQEQDRSVLLVDADVLNPRLSDALDLLERPGLLDYLEDPARSAASVAYRTDVAGLSVMPAGTPRPNAAELLSGARMAAFVSEVVRQFTAQMVVLDSPPILPTSESRILAEWAGQIVVVVRAGSTPQDSVRLAVESLPPQKPINLVLNSVAGRGVQGTYGYGYGYGYGGTSAPAKAREEDI